MNPSEINTKAIIDLMDNQCSFAFWRYPFAEKPEFVAARHCIEVAPFELANYLVKDGFLLSPFNLDKHPVLFIPNEKGLKLANNINSKSVSLNQSSPYCVVKNEYLAHANFLIENIKNDVAQKVILSRCLKAEFEYSKADELFEQLCLKYPAAYVFCVYTPQSGLWIGASPELFLKKNNNSYATVALAGTRRNMDDVNGAEENWQYKEVDEQQLVTDYIYDVLKMHNCNNINVEGPKQIVAGPITHLKTAFEFDARHNQDETAALLLDLHPTPAVCGLPKSKANELIAQTELHDRLYYGGFMGPVGDSNFHFFVALRCMKVEKTESYLFVGGGLTRFSVSHDEWNETVLKSQTLLSVLKNI